VQHGSHSFDVFSYADASLYERLKATGYDPDPVIKKFTGISIEAPQEFRYITRSIRKPLGIIRFDAGMKYSDEPIGRERPEKEK